MTQPIDMQSELGRATMVERVQDAVTRAALAASQRELIEKKEEDQLKETQVLETSEAQSEHVDEDGKRKNPFVGRRGRRSAKKGSEAELDGGRDPAQASGADDEHEFDVSV